MLPAEHHKVLVNIRKAEARSKRRKQAEEQQDDSDSEEETPKTKNERCVVNLLTHSAQTSYTFACFAV